MLIDLSQGWGREARPCLRLQTSADICEGGHRCDERLPAFGDAMSARDAPLRRRLSWRPTIILFGAEIPCSHQWVNFPRIALSLEVHAGRKEMMKNCQIQSRDLKGNFAINCSYLKLTSQMKIFRFELKPVLVITWNLSLVR